MNFDLIPSVVGGVVERILAIRGRTVAELIVAQSALPEASAPPVA